MSPGERPDSVRGAERARRGANDGMARNFPVAFILAGFRHHIAHQSLPVFLPELDAELSGAGYGIRGAATLAKILTAVFLGLDLGYLLCGVLVMLLTKWGL